MITFPWYDKAEQFLEPSWNLMVFIAIIIIIITLLLIYNGKAVPLAAWLVYLFMP